MKTLAFGIILIVLVGFAGFFYRNIAERSGAPDMIACTADAKLCPDGSAVGRTGPACEFVPCAFPNVEIEAKGLAFAVPAGYVVEQTADASLLSRFTKPSLSESVRHTITVQSYPLGEGESADDVILAHTRYQPADMQAEDFSRFETTLINGKEFRSTVIERFEALVQSSYYLVRTEDVLVFTITEHDVSDWMNPDLQVETLPEHKALLELLGTLQVAGE